MCCTVAITHRVSTQPIYQLEHSLNIAQMDARGRRNTRRTCKLQNDIPEVLQLLNDGVTQREVAVRFGVSQAAVTRVLAKYGPNVKRRSS